MKTWQLSSRKKKDNVKAMLDAVSWALDILSILPPPAGVIFGLTAAGLSALRGDYVGAFLSILCSLPGIGILLSPLKSLPGKTRFLQKIVTGGMVLIKFIIKIGKVGVKAMIASVKFVATKLTKYIAYALKIGSNLFKSLRIGLKSGKSASVVDASKNIARGILHVKKKICDTLGNDNLKAKGIHIVFDTIDAIGKTFKALKLTRNSNLGKFIGLSVTCMKATCAPTSIGQVYSCMANSAALICENMPSDCLDVIKKELEQFAGADVSKDNDQSNDSRGGADIPGGDVSESECLELEGIDAKEILCAGGGGACGSSGSAANIAFVEILAGGREKLCPYCSLFDENEMKSNSRLGKNNGGGGGLDGGVVDYAPDRLRGNEIEHAPEETAGIINNNNDDELPMPDGLAVNRNMPMKFNMIGA